MKALFIIISLMLTSSLYGQTSSDVYVIVTSEKVLGTERGILDGTKRLHLTKEAYEKTNSISFTIGSKEKGYEIMLFHSTKKNATRDSQILDLPLSRLSTFNVVDLENLVRTKSRDEVWKWMMANFTKKVWVIDRNDFYKSSPSLPANDRMKLIETWISVENIPDEVIIIEK